MLTAGFDDLSQNLKKDVNDLYIGTVENGQFLNGNKTTYNPGDVINGGTGENTLRLFVSQGADADGVTVSNIQTLDLRVNTGDSYFSDSRSDVVMTDWDGSLEQINIRSNKSDIIIADQQSIADVSISDQSTVNGAASYEFNYAAGVVDGVADALNVTFDNVNGTGGAEVRIDDDIERLNVTIDDRAGDQYASDVNLIAEGVAVLTVDGGRTGQNFTLEANNVAEHAAFDSTAFAGNMDLTSNDIETAAFGEGSDVASFDGIASSVDASYNMGEGDNTLDLHVAFAGEAMAGAGDDSITAHATVAGSSIAAGNGANTVTIEGAHAGAITAGSGADEVSVISTTAGAVVSLDLRGQALVADETITLTVSFVVAEGVKTFEEEFTLVGANATAIRNDLIAQINESDFGDLFDVTAGTPTGVIKFTSDLRLPELAVTSTTGAMTVVSQFSSSIAAGAGDNTVAVAGEHSGVIETTSGNDNIGVDTTTLGSLISAGDGDNLVVVGELTADEDEGTVTIVGAANGGDIVVGAGNDDIVVGATGAHSTINAGNGDNRIVVGTVTLDTTTDEPTAFTGEDHTGSILSGSGDDQVWTANVTAAVISVGDGTNTVTVEGDVVDSDITFGNGDDNSLIISGDLSAAEPGTITFGNGDNKTLTVGGDITTESVVMGTGTGSTISVAGNVVETSITVAGESTTLNVEGYIDEGSSITLGNGANVMTTDSIYYSDVTMGSGADTLTLQDGAYTSTIEMGGGNDTLTVGANEETDYAIGWYENEDLVKTVVDMGAGDDSVMLKTSGDGLNDANDGYVYTNGFVDGGDGADTLTFEAQGSAKLIIRDLTQVASLDLQKAEGEVYAVGDVVSVTFTRGEEEFTVSYTLVNADFLQGADSVAVNVALHLAAKLNTTDSDYRDHFNVAQASAGVITIESRVPHEDFVITSAQADVQVLQNSDTRITDFETLNLVALNTAEGDDLEINANFELINGTDNINLDSQLERVATVAGEDTNGAYTSYESGGTSTFTLENLVGGEAILVSGYESSATGNQQVSHIVVESLTGDHVVGDKITVTIGDAEVVYTVSAADLNSDTAGLDANNIARSLSLAITATATAAGLTVALDDNQITLVGQAGEEVYVEVTQTRANVENVDVSGDVDNTGPYSITWTFDNLAGGGMFTIGGNDALIMDPEFFGFHATVEDGEIVDMNYGFPVEGGIYETDFFIDWNATSLTLTVNEYAPYASLFENSSTSRESFDSSGVTNYEDFTTTLAGGQTTWTVENSFDTMQAGDVVTVTIGEDEFSFTVSAGDCERHDAENIFDILVAHFGADAVSFDWGTVNFAQEATVSIERSQDLDIGNTTTHIDQTATATDDSLTDVVINANLAADATDTVMDLTVQGYGDVDLDITGGEDSGYTGLNLKLGDAYNHVIDTGGDFNFISAIQKLNLEEAAIDFLPKAYDVVFNDGNLVRIILSELNYFAEEVLVSTDGGETFDEFIGVEPTMDDFTEWAFSEYGMIYDEAFLTRIEKVTVYSDLPTEEGVESYVVESTSEGTGNFNDSITVSDVAGIDTSGSDITLDNVGAHTVTSTTKANLTIDQYGVRAQVATLYNGLEDETIHVTTGTGDDHLSTLAPSAVNDGSSINLGSGANRLSLGWGENDGVGSSELESIGGIDYTGNLSQLDILNDVQLSEDETTLTMPGGVDNVEVLTFTDLETADENNVASDLTVVGAGNNFSIESGDDFELGYEDSSVVIGGAPGTSNLTYDITAADDGDITPFTDPLTDPSGNSSAASVEIGHRVKGATYVPGFAPGVVLPVPDTFSGTGDNAVDDEQMEVYYGTYDAETGIFTVTLTPEENIPDPFVAPTHTLVLYDNDPVGQVAYAEGLVFSGFFHEDGWLLPDSPAPGENFVEFDDTQGLYVPFDDGNDGNGGNGSGLDIGVLTVSGADGEEITGDLNVTVDDDVSFNIGNKQLASLTVDAQDNVDVYVFGNAESEIQIDSITMTSDGNEFLNLTILENTATDIAIGSIEMLATAGEDSAAPNLIVSGNTDTVLEVDSVNMQAGISHGDYHDTGVAIEDNLRTTVTMGALALSSVDADVNVSASGNTDSTVTFDTLDVDAGCYAEMFVNDNLDSEFTVTGNVNLEGFYYANLEIDNNTGTNVSLAADGVVSLVNCYDDGEGIDVSVSGNLNNYDPAVGGPDINVPMIKTYSVTLGELVLDSADDTDINVSNNVDDTYFGDLNVTIGDVDVVSYDDARFNIGNNESSTVVVGDVDMLSQGDAYIDIYSNDGRLYTSSWGNQVREEIDFADITLGDVTVDSTDSYTWMWINGNTLADISVGAVALTADEYADFYVYNNDSSTGEALSEVSVDVDSVSLVSGTSSNLWIEYNDAYADYIDVTATVDITLGEVDMTADGYAYFGIYDNNVDSGENSTAEVNITVGDLTLNSSMQSEFSIETNYVYSDANDYNSSAALNITLGAVDMTSGSDSDSYTAFEVEDMDAEAYDGGDSSQSVSIESVAIQSENYTYVYIYDSVALANGDNSSASLNVDIGSVDITSQYGLDFGINDNDALAGDDSSDSDNLATIDISVGTLTVSTGEDDADININDNDALIYGFDANWNDATVNIAIESVDQSSDWYANLYIQNNDAVVEYNDIWGYQDDNTANVNVTIGTVSMDASLDANFDIDDNDAYVDSSWGEDNTTAVNIVVEAVTMTASRNADFAIDGNDAWVGGEDWFADASVDISVADVSIDAADDVSFLIDNNVASNSLSFASEATVTVSTGDVTIDAGDDVRYVVDGYESTLTEQGDVTITAGLDSATAETDEDVYSEVFMNFMDVEGTTSISIEAQSNANGEGNIYGYLEDAYDLESLTLKGTNAEVYLVSDIGVHNETGLFTLDLTGMTGSFTEGASYYDPLGENAEYNDVQDNGSYVQTWDADFGVDNDVIVKIGSGDVIYNAQHSNFSGDSVDFQYDGINSTSDWNDNEGWFSLGYDLDLDPVREEQIVSVWLGDGFDGYGEGDIEVYDMVINVGSKTFVVTWDGWGEDENDFNVEWIDNGVSYDLTLDEMAWEIGASDAGIYVDENWGENYDYVFGELKFFGPTNGSAFEPTDLITNATARGYQWWWDADDGGNWEAFNYDETMGFYSYDGDAANDGLGNSASETFEFDAGGIGEVVIGGFRPNGFFEQSEVDRLDFSAFADINSAADLIISIDDNDGYFDDVIIDFVNDDYGVVRLVGVGEYFTDFNVNGIANSINFA